MLCGRYPEIERSSSKYWHLLVLSHSDLLREEEHKCLSRTTVDKIDKVEPKTVLYKCRCWVGCTIRYCVTQVRGVGD